MARAFGYSLGVADLHRREIAVRHGRVPAPAKAGRPDSYGHGRERGMKVSLPGTEELSITPHHYQRLVRKLAGKPEERIVSYLMLRSLKQARYAADAAGTFRTGIRRVHAFHFADSPVSGFDRASHAEMGTGASESKRAAAIRIRRATRRRLLYRHKELEELGVGNFRSGAARSVGGTRVAGLEDGAVHGSSISATNTKG